MRAAAFVAAACLAWAAVAAQAPQAPPPVFRGGVDIVHLDVSVLDRDRRPVRRLTAADFTVLADGHPQPIGAFASIDVPEAHPPAEPAAWVRTVPPDVRTNAIARAPEGRLFVLLLDDGLIPADPAAIASAKRIARMAIDRLGPADQMAVVFTVGSRGAQNFTSERGKLLAAVDTLQQGYASHLLGWDSAVFDDQSNRWILTNNGDAGYFMGSVRTLESVADTLIAAPQRRKAIIYVSPGVTADIESASRPALATPGKSMMIREANGTLVGRLPELYRRLQHANVTIYPVDPTGLGGLEAYVLQRAAALRPVREATLPFSPMDDWLDPPGPPMAMDLSRRVTSLNLDFLRTAAQNTGGMAIVNTNDFDAGVDRIFQENSSYYLLGFSAPASHRPGSLHRLEVRVRRDGVQVRARTRYAAPEIPPSGTQTSAAAPGGTTAARTSAPPLTTALAGPVPSGDLPMRVSLAPFAVPGSTNAVVAVTLGLQHPMVAEDADRAFELQVRAFSADGVSRGGLQQAGKIAALPPLPGGDTGFDLLAQIELPPGRHELRLAARLDPANLAGSVFADVVVPDFAGAPLSLSGVLFETRPRGHAGPLEALVPVVPVIPTSKREFTLRELAGAFVRVYQGGDAALAPASIQITVQDGHDRLVYNNRLPLRVERFDATTRHADVHFDLPLRAMQPGSHLLTFEARLGTHTVQRQVRFVFR
jgi:VWFA-related protein